MASLFYCYSGRLFDRFHCQSRDDTLKKTGIESVIIKGIANAGLIIAVRFKCFCLCKCGQPDGRGDEGWNKFRR